MSHVGWLASIGLQPRYEPCGQVVICGLVVSLTEMSLVQELEQPAALVMFSERLKL